MVGWLPMTVTTAEADSASDVGKPSAGLSALIEMVFWVRPALNWVLPQTFLQIRPSVLTQPALTNCEFTAPPGAMVVKLPTRSSLSSDV